MLTSMKAGLNPDDTDIHAYVVREKRKERKNV